MNFHSIGVFQPVESKSDISTSVSRVRKEPIIKETRNFPDYRSFSVTADRNDTDLDFACQNTLI